MLRRLRSAAIAGASASAIVFALVDARADELATQGATAPTTEWNSPAMAATGVVLTGTGALAATGGLVFVAADWTSCKQDSDVITCSSWGRSLGELMLTGAAVLAVVGTPLIVAGAWQVPAEDVRTPPTTAQLRVGPARADLVIDF